MAVTPLRFTAVLLSLTLGMAAAGCSGGGDSAGEEAPNPEEALASAAEAMAEVDSMAFTLEQEGADVPIDAAGQLNFQAATGRIVRPASADAVLSVEALGFSTEVGAIAIDGDIWFTNPLSGAWTEAPDTFTFDPAALLDPDRGIPALLAETAATAGPVDTGPAADGGTDTGDAGEDGGGDADDTVDRSGWDGYSVVASAERVDILTGGLLSEETAVDVWIDRDSGRVAELSFEIPVAGDVSRWQMLITAYDIEADITPPEVGAADS